MEPILPGITPLEECITRIARKDEQEQEAYKEINNITQRILATYGRKEGVPSLVEKLTREVVTLRTIATEVAATSNQNTENPPEELQRKLEEEQNTISAIISQIRNSILKKP